MPFFEFTGQLTVPLPSLVRLATTDFVHLPSMFFDDGRAHDVRVLFTMIPGTAQLQLEFVRRSASAPAVTLADEVAESLAITITKPTTDPVQSIIVTGTRTDRTNPYEWTASNGPEVIAFTAGLAAGDTITLRLAYFEYHVEVDWSDSGDYDHAMSDVTSDVASVIHAFRGRDYGSMIYGRSVAGRLQFELTNHHGHYERFNPASPLTGLVVPQRRIRLWIEGIAGEAHLRLWTGRIDRYTPKEIRGGADRTTVVAYGVLTRLTQRQVSIALQSMISTGDAMEDVLEAAGLADEDIGDMDGNRMMARFWIRPQNAIQAAREVEETEGGFLRENPTGDLFFEDSNFRVRAGRMMATARFTDSTTPGMEIPITFVDRDDPVKDIANIVQVPVRQFSVSTERILWQLAEPILFNISETRTFVVRYPNDLTARNVVAIASFTTPATGTDFRLTQNQDGSGNLRAGTITAEQTADGLLLTITTGGAAAWLSTLRVRGTVLEVDDPVVVQHIDQDSIDEYGPRTYPVPAQFISNVRDADAYGQFLLSILKDPQSKIRAGFNINNHVDDALGLELSDRVALTTRETGGDMFIEAIEHHIDIRGRRHDMSLTLYPAIAYFSDVLVLDEGPGLDTGVLGR